MSELIKAQEALQRIQSFDSSQLARREDLGAQFHFEEAAAHTEKAVSFLRKLSVDSLVSLPAEFWKQLTIAIERIETNNDNILAFDATQQNATSSRDAYTNTANTNANNTFKNLLPYISYALYDSIDFEALEDQARAFNDGVHKDASKLIEEVRSTEAESKATLRAIKDAAADAGVSKEGKYFAEESANHQKLAHLWLVATIGMTAILVTYGILSFDRAAPDSIEQAIVFVANKFLIVFTLVFMLVVCGRNFQANRHNEIVNKHRENSLKTYRTLVRAGEDEDLQNIVLFHAAASIYQLHDTGFTRHPSGDESASANMMPKPTLPLKIPTGDA